MTLDARSLSHPAFTGSLAVLVLNDHVLKHRWPGLVTGKLSDVAGVFVVAVLLAALTRRPRMSLVATGLGFTALKLVPAVADAAVPVLGGRTITDPTDLVALAALVPAAHLLRRCSERPRPSERPGTATVAHLLGRWGQHLRRTERAGTVTDHPTHGAPPRSAPRQRPGQRWDRPGRRALLQQSLTLAVLPVAGLAVTATSCLPYPSVEAIVDDDGKLVALVSDDYGGPLTRYRSSDGGVTWVEAGPAGNLAVPTTTTEGCLDDGRCFRVRDSEIVEERTGDGGWATAFAFTEEETRRIDRRSDGCSGKGLLSDAFASVTIAGSGDDQVVLVTMATQGVLRFDPGTDEWSRHGIGPAEPIRTDGPLWVGRLAWAPVVAVVVTPMLSTALSVRDRALGARRTLTMMTAVLIYGGLLATMVFLLAFSRPDYVDFGVGVFGITLAIFLLSLLGIIPKARPRGLAPPPPPPPPAPTPPSLPRS